MTLQSVPPPPCICQHGAQHHTESACNRCKCDRYIRDNDRYPSGLIVST